MRGWHRLVWCVWFIVGGGGAVWAADDVNTTLTDAITQSSPTSRYSSGLGIAAQQIFGPAPSTDLSTAGYDTLTPGSYYYTEEPAPDAAKSSSAASPESPRSDRAAPGARRGAPKPRPQPYRYDELQP